MNRSIVLAAMTALLSGCASLPPARMALPEALRTAPPQAFAGAGYGQHGHFSVAGHTVRFTRSRDRLAIFDERYARTRGELHLMVEGPDLSAPLQVDCRAEERTASLSIFSVEVEPMAYRCRLLSEGRTIPARLEVQTARPTRLAAVHERRGEIALDRVILQIRSVHDIQGGRVPTDLPIGYVFSRDGAPVAAVEINGTPVLRLASGLDTAEARAAVVAAAALGLLWDTSDS